MNVEIGFKTRKTVWGCSKEGRRVPWKKCLMNFCQGSRISNFLPLIVIKLSRRYGGFAEVKLVRISPHEKHCGRYSYDIIPYQVQFTLRKQSTLLRTRVGLTPLIRFWGRTIRVYNVPGAPAPGFLITIIIIKMSRRSWKNWSSLGAGTGQGWLAFSCPQLLPKSLFKLNRETMWSFDGYETNIPFLPASWTDQDGKISGRRLR